MLFGPLMQWLSIEFRRVIEYLLNINAKLEQIQQNQETHMALDAKTAASVDRLEKSFNDEVAAIQAFIESKAQPDGSLAAADVTALDTRLDALSDKLEAETGAIKAAGAPAPTTGPGSTTGPTTGTTT